MPKGQASFTKPGSHSMLFGHHFRHQFSPQLEAALKQQQLCQGLKLPDAVGVPGEQFLLLLRHGRQEFFFVAGNQMQRLLVFLSGREGVFARFQCKVQ